MTKSQFLRMLREKLSVLEDSEIEDILSEYEIHIEEKVKTGKTQKQAIEDFGDIDELVKDILSAYKVKGEPKSSTSKAEGIINTVVDEFVEFCKKLGEIFSNKTGEDILRIICKILLVLLLIWILRLPFELIAWIGQDILAFLPTPFETLLSLLWRFIVNIIYVIMGIMMFYQLIKKLVLDEQKDSKPTKKKVLERKNEKMEKQVTKIEYKEESGKEKINYIEDESPKYSHIEYAEDTKNNPTDILLNVIMIIIKCFIVLVSLPLLVAFVGLVIGFGMMIAAAFGGVYMISLFFIIGGLLLMFGSVLGMIFTIVFRKGGERR